MMKTGSCGFKNVIFYQNNKLDLAWGCKCMNSAPSRYYKRSPMSLHKRYSNEYRELDEL